MPGGSSHKVGYLPIPMGDLLNSLLKRNVIANFIGRGWAGGLTLALIPVYGRLLGIEALALIGLYALLVQIVGLLDMGLSPTLAREAARLTAVPNTAAAAQQSNESREISADLRSENARELRDLVRTLEVVYWPIAILIALVVGLVSSPVAHHWIPPSRVITPATVQRAVLLMGISLAVQWPYTLYEGALMGLHRQVLLNIVNTICVTVRGFGALVVLHFVQTVEAFFLWQTAAYAVQTIAVGISLWCCLPHAPTRPAFQRARCTEYGDMLSA